MRVHLIQELVVDIGIGKVVPVGEKKRQLVIALFLKWIRHGLSHQYEPHDQVSNVEKVAQECAAVVLLRGVHL